MAKHHYPALTGIRALAIGMVFIHHYGPDVPVLQHPFVRAVIGQLFAGVVLFFVLSGFLIADRYFDSAKSHFRSYIMRRVCRVVPLYALLTFLTFGVSMVRGDAPLATVLFELAANLTFVRGWFNALWDTGLLQGWSLTVEMTFYALAPLFFAWIAWRKRMLVILPTASLTLGIALVVVCDGRAPLGFMGSFDLLFGVTFLGRCAEFFVGIAVALFLRRNGPMSFRFSTLIGGVISLASIGAGAYWHVDYGDPGGVLIHNFLLPIGVGIFYWGLLTEKTMVRSVLASPIVLFMGRTSYAFYLIHLGVVFTVVQALTQNLVLTFVVLQVVAWLLYRTVEQPVARWSHRRFPVHVEHPIQSGPTR